MLDAYSLLRAMNGIREEDIVMADKQFDSPKPMRSRTKRMVTLALAAALILALGAGAWALFFSMDHRVPEPEESFRIHWEESPSGYIEWKNVGLAVTFPETEESRAVEFRPGWLPEEMASLQDDAWVSRLTAERLCFEGGSDFVPAYDDMTQPMLIESFAMSQFNQGGALLLLDYTAGAVTEETWVDRNVDVLYFSASIHFDANPEHDLPERTFVQNYVLLSDPEAGWVVRIGGELDLETLLEVARNLEIRETGEILRYEDFTDHFALFNAGAG